MFDKQRANEAEGSKINSRKKMCTLKSGRNCVLKYTGCWDYAGYVLNFLHKKNHIGVDEFKINGLGLQLTNNKSSTAQRKKNVSGQVPLPVV